ncbi:hypothetical protein C8F01DRAFT_1371603 [Mycena amicta]|nr:hypothetical protein C8F01DRAFT_1371603 [Mycena amicta]
MFQRRLANTEEDWTTFLVGSGVTVIFGREYPLDTSDVSDLAHCLILSIRAGKSVVQAIVGVFFFGDFIDVYRLSGVALITLGTILYTQTHNSAQSGYEPVSTVDADDIEKQAVDEDSDVEEEKDVREAEREARV